MGVRRYAEVMSTASDHAVHSVVPTASASRGLRMLAIVGVVSVVAAIPAACGSTPSPMGPSGSSGGPQAEPALPTMPATLQHVVLVDLADDADIPAMRAASDALLPRIPTVRGYVCGTPVDIGRANVSRDYDLGIIVQFDSIEDYKAYLEHPIHQDLVREWRPKWRKSYIVDFAP